MTTRFKDFFFERDDYKTANKSSILFDKLMAYFKKYDGRLSQIADFVDKDNNAYYFHMSHIDPRIKDLIVVITEAQQREVGQVVNPASFIIRGDNNYILLRTLMPNMNIDDKGFYKVFNNLSVGSSFTHELTHYYDSKRIDKDYFSSEKNQEIQKKVRDLARKEMLQNTEETVEEVAMAMKKYRMLPEELNAVFMSVAVLLLNVFKKDSKTFYFYLNNFKPFKESFVKFLEKSSGSKLDEMDKERILKRIYSFWNELKEKFDEKVEDKLRKEIYKRRAKE